jgi:hypothetical protein
MVKEEVGGPWLTVAARPVEREEEKADLLADGLLDATDQMRRDIAAIEDLVDYGDKENHREAVMYLHDSGAAASEAARHLGATQPALNILGQGKGVRIWGPFVISMLAIGYGILHTLVMEGATSDHIQWLMAVCASPVAFMLARD